MNVISVNYSDINEVCLCDGVVRPDTTMPVFIMLFAALIGFH